MFDRLARGVSGLIRRFSPMQQMLAARSQYLHGGTASKISVNERTAFNYAAVYACIRCIAETKASLPIQVYENLPNGKKAKVSQHYVSGLLGMSPNDDQTPMVWSEFRQAQVLSSGNGYCEIVFDGRGVPIQLIPRDWKLVTPFRSTAGQLLYEVRSANGGVTRTLDTSEMIHVPGFGDGITGWSPLRLAAEAIGIGLGQDQSAATLLGNGVKPSIVVTTPGLMQPERRKELQEQLDTNYSGQNAHKAMIADGGITVTPISIPLTDAQFLESREFQEEEIARVFRVPPHMIGLLRRATFSNIEAQDLSFEKHTMRPWLVRDEQELNRKLFPRSQWGRFFVKHNVDALLRADIKTRYEAYKTAILAGIKTQNEVRELEDLEPAEGGDKLLLPEAIFGKSGGKGQPSNAKAPAPAKSRAGLRRSKPCIDVAPEPEPSQLFRALVRDVVRGLIQREITQIERSHSDLTKLATFFDRHAAVVAEKLSVFGVSAGTVAHKLLAHRAAALKHLGPMPTRTVDSFRHQWLAEVNTLADELVHPTGLTPDEIEDDEEFNDDRDD